MNKPKHRAPPRESTVDWQDRKKWHQWRWGPWSRATAPYILLILIQRAREGRPITYEDLAHELRVRFGFKEQPRKTQYGGPVGLVGHVLEDLSQSRGETIPPINVIVVNKQTKLPGVGADELARSYHKSKRKKFDSQDRRSMLLGAIDDVKNYGEQWVSVAKDLGSILLTTKTGKLDDGKAIKLPRIKVGHGGEGVHHKALKQWVVNNPEHFKRFGNFKKGEPEFLISSGDRPDVHFSNSRQRLAVEVKPSEASNDDLKRGVYQVVKYRAVMRAEQRSLNHVPNAQAILVSVKRPDDEIRLLMQRLQVVHLTAPANAERL